MSLPPSGFRLADDFIDIVECIRWDYCAPCNRDDWLSVSLHEILPRLKELQSARQTIKDWFHDRKEAAGARALITSIDNKLRELIQQASRIKDDPHSYDALMPEFQRRFSQSDIEHCYEDLLRNIPDEVALIDRFIHHVGSYIQEDQPFMRPRPPVGSPRYPDALDPIGCPVPGAVRTLLDAAFNSDTPEGKAYMLALNEHHDRQTYTLKHIGRYGMRLAAVFVELKRDATGVLKVVYCMSEGGGPSNVVKFWGDLRSNLRQAAIELGLSTNPPSPKPKRSRGRPQGSQTGDVKLKKRICDAWDTGSFPSYAECARALGDVGERTVKLVIDARRK